MMMSLDDDDDGVQISRNISAFCSASRAHQPGDDRAVCGVHLFRVAVHIFSSKIKPQCFNFPCEPLYFSFYSIYRSWGFAEADCGSVRCFCVCCASLRPAQFSVPAAHSVFWCVCAFLSVVFSLPSCPAVCIWLCFAWHKHAHFWKLSTLSYHVSINCWEPLKKKIKCYPQVLIVFLPRHGRWEVYWTVIQTGKETFFSPESLKAACASSLTACTLALLCGCSLGWASHRLKPEMCAVHPKLVVLVAPHFALCSPDLTLKQTSGGTFFRGDSLNLATKGDRRRGFSLAFSWSALGITVN